MTNDLSQHGIGNIAFQGIHDSNINVTQILGKSAEYKDLLNQLEMQQELFAYVPEDQTEKRLRISQAIAQLTAQIEQFKADVTRLAAEFNRIEINTDRLRRAKEHFEQGEIAAARAVFDSEREQMQDENNRLVRAKERYEQDVLPKLKHSSDEFYLRALLERTAYDNPNWLADTCEYFERSINAQATEDNVFGYALFLQNHNRYDEAEHWYQKCLAAFTGGDQLRYARVLNNLANIHKMKNALSQAETEYVDALAIHRKLPAVKSMVYLRDVAGLLNNLGLLHYAKNELEKAEAEYVEALAIQRTLVTAHPADCLPDVAMTLNNLGNLHKAIEDFVKAEAEYIEALSIRQELAAVNPAAYLPGVAITLNNLANLHSAKNELQQAEARYLEALAIQRHLAALNPTAYLPDVALTLNNLGVLHSAINEPEKVEVEYIEALRIRRKLAAMNPSAYLPDVAMTLVNIAIFLAPSLPNRERSINYALEVILIVLPIAKDVPYTQKYLQAAVDVLQDWGLSMEDIQRMLADAISNSSLS